MLLQIGFGMLEGFLGVGGKKAAPAASRGLLAGQRGIATYYVEA